MTAQLRSAASGIPNNIAEGAARQGTREFIHFLHIALGSASELDTQLELSKRVNLCSGPELDSVQVLVMRVNHMIRALIRALRSRKKD